MIIKLRFIAVLIVMLTAFPALQAFSVPEELVLPEIKDPMHMSDEDFFGIWDGNEWTAEPVLRYDSFSDLNGVLDQTKKGDYIKAKEELLKYYKSRSGMPEYKLPTTGNVLHADIASEKIFGWLQIDNVAGKTVIRPEWQYYTVDLTIGSTVPTGFFLFDSDMDGSSVEIHSRENSNGAYLELVEDGEIKKFPVKADTYISAGDNISKNFGTAGILYAREAAGSERDVIGTDTARPYFRFDIGEITGKVTSVKLSFYARSNKSTDKKIFVFTSGNERLFDENTLSWAKHYPQIFNYKETDYLWDNGMASRWNLDTEWINYMTRMYQASHLISQYLATGDELYAYRTLEVVISMYTAQNRAFFPRDLEAGWRTEYLCILFFGTLNSKTITPETLTAQLKYMYLHMDALKEIGIIGAFNQVSAKLSGFLRLAGYFPELEKEGSWELVKGKMENLYAAYLNNDGSYIEATSGYISGVVSELRTTLDLIALRDGEENENYINLLEYYRKLVKYIFDMSMPHGFSSPWGDGPRFNSKMFCYNEYKLKPEVDTKGHFEFFATEGSYGNEPDYTSIVYKDKAIAFLKSGWMPNDFGATICANYGGTHSHMGDLGLDIYAYGSPLLIEAGGSSYSQGALMAGVSNKTYSHNTIEINRKNQEGYDYGNINVNQPQKLLLATNKLFDFVEAGSDKIYPGFDVNRKVLFLHNSYFIVSDYIIPPEGKHVYKQAWRPDTSSNITLDPITKAMTTHYLNRPNIQVIPADPEKLAARIEKSYVNNPVDGEQLTDYVRYCREDAAGAQTFDTILYPDKQGDKTYVSVKRIELGIPTEQATALKIDIGLNTGYYYSSNISAASDCTFDRYSTDGQMSYIELNRRDEISKIAVTRTKILKKDGVELLSSSVTIPDLGINLKGQTLELFTENGSLPDLKIQLSNSINNVTLNGSGIEFSYSGNAILISKVR